MLVVCISNSTKGALRHGKWTKAEVQGKFPSAYAGGSCCIGTKIYVVGGFNGSDDSSTLHILDTGIVHLA